MEREKIFEKLSAIFQDNFDNDDIILTEKTVPADIEGWDSLEQVNLIVILQEEFRIRFNINEVNSMGTIGDMVDIIMKKQIR